MEFSIGLIVNRKRQKLIENLSKPGFDELNSILPGKKLPVNAEETFMKHAGGLLSPPRGLDALSFTGPLVHRQQVTVQEFVTGDVMTRSSNPKRPKRTTVLELVVPGFGWLGVTGVDMDGTQTLEKTLKNARIQISTCDGIEVHARSALFPFEMTDTNKNMWK
ncbi:hypothetical protein DYB32_000685 [Aphanomyces invadans]|uniref:Uncharacterized protein n=1 Tax=Aphanomyces invadans TaxID=157072 RepID=A0A3R6W404_9STRA|nr:hypothetical protein DYB32_000685 [Aphanomyces invadans]